MIVDYSSNAFCCFEWKRLKIGFLSTGFISLPSHTLRNLYKLLLHQINFLKVLPSIILKSKEQKNCSTVEEHESLAKHNL